ncbi:hypothetical protein ACH4UR_25085 [Streptomyces lydicus]|uniref:hypothetical protein n=1 Tax=Streptomyces lydicus TaxID=47763 RepID=UPI0033D038C5
MKDIMTRPHELRIRPTQSAEATHDLLRRQVAEGDEAARLAGRRVPRTPSEQRDRITGLVTALAEHFATVRPSDAMTERARMTAALRVTGTTRTARPLLYLLPSPNPGETRMEYAKRLRGDSQPRSAPVTDQPPVSAAS